MKFGVIQFPGSNCDQDPFWVLESVAKQEVTYLWHESHDLQRCDVVIVPGGFSYGDYLRTGAIARFSPVMESVRKFADGGGIVLGICNGFQILCESHMLPGALLRNAGLKYICRSIHLRVENNETPFTHSLKKGEVLEIPIGHMEGNYFCDAETLKQLQDQNRIIFRYSSKDGNVNAASNPNGSLDNIAGISNEGGNVLGMMPHPERSSEEAMGCKDGFRIFESLVGSLVTR
jgi:phosphoribosylformylglycinamidine synthase subunit PurQ / glutaminase